MIIRETQKIEIASKIQNIRLVEEFIDEICDYFNVNNDYFGNIIVAVTEAVENAILHGNKNDETKKVTVSFESTHGCLVFSVADEGFGFNQNSIPDPTDPKNENENAGRGLYLMKSLADDIKFEENGRIIQLNFAVASIHRELANKRIKAFREYQVGKGVKQEKN